MRPIISGATIVALFLFSFSSLDAARKEKKPVTGFIDFNYYYDTRDFNVLTINTLLNLPARFQYFSLVNYFNELDASRNLDLASFYTEQHLRWTPVSSIPVDLTMLYTSASGTQNDTLRFGFRWMVSKNPWCNGFFEKIHLFYFVNFHPLQIELTPSPGRGWQIEHVYSLKVFPSLFHERVSIGGFADHNMRYGASFGRDNHVWVTEHQLAVRMIQWLHAVAEFRRNEYLSKKNGLGLGLEYKVSF